MFNITFLWQISRYLPYIIFFLSNWVKSLSCIQLFATPWTAAHQAPLSMGILQAGILEWFAISFSRESSRAWDQTYVFSIPAIPVMTLTNKADFGIRLN